MTSRHPVGASYAACVSFLAVVLLPTVASAQSTAGQPDDHFMCYKAKASAVSICADGAASEGTICTSDADCGGATDSCIKNKFAKTVVTLEDEFDVGVPADHTALKPATLCVPADKEGEGVVDLDTHLLS